MKKVRDRICCVHMVCMYPYNVPVQEAWSLCDAEAVV